MIFGIWRFGMIPLALDLSNDRRMLSLNWPEGHVTCLDALYLRDNSRNARHLRAKMEMRDPTIPESVTITDIELIGSYAVRLHFSDGHNGGIYPWSYLQDLSDAVVAS